MTPARPKVARRSLANPPQESKGWMKSQAEACPKGGSRYSVAVRGAARAYWRWNF